MNKYLKILALSGGLVGAIAPTAISLNKNPANEFTCIYNSIESMQQTLPKLSKINYHLDIAANGENIEISTSNEDQQTDLSQQQTLEYLDETLKQTNIEYEQLKSTLSKAIEATMQYLEQYQSGENELSNEQRITIKEQANSIKFLAETLEDLSENVICAIDGKNCDEEFEETAKKYIATINNLENHIQALYNAITSLNFINQIRTPFYAPAPNFIYNYDSFHNDNSLQDKIGDEIAISGDNGSNIEESSQNEENIGENTLNNSSDEYNGQPLLEVAETNSDSNNNEDKPTTFGLKSNIDSYAPTKRNIDTFFNTALYENEYMNGGYGYMPYGNGYGYGYNNGYMMPNMGGNFNNPYGNLNGGYNSNLINRAEMEKQQNELKQANSVMSNTSPTENNKPTKEEISKKSFKPEKNIDSYTGVTIKSNINTMGESKISKFFKSKYSGLKNKIKNKQNEVINKEDVKTPAINMDDINQPNNSNPDNAQTELNKKPSLQPAPPNESPTQENNQ